MIASGCTDRTVEIVQKIQAARDGQGLPGQTTLPHQSLHVQTAPGIPATTGDHPNLSAKHHPALRLIIQKERTGKSSAVNLFIKEAAEDVLVLESADTIPAPQTIEHLCAPFLDPAANPGAPPASHRGSPAAPPASPAGRPVGLAGAHPVPTNGTKTFIGFCVTTMWEMHHQIALKNPKCGELIAFRRAFPAALHPTPGISAISGISANPGIPLTPGGAFRRAFPAAPIITGIPAESAVDEASIEAEILKHNLKIIYVPEAVVYNKGPETVREFIAQRRRIAAGHIWLQKNFHHKISTNNKLSVLSLTLSRFTLNPKTDFWLIGMMFLEAWSKILGRCDYWFKKKKHVIWERISTTKNPE